MCLKNQFQQLSKNWPFVNRLSSFVLQIQQFHALLLFVRLTNREIHISVNNWFQKVKYKLHVPLYVHILVIPFVSIQKRCMHVRRDHFVYSLLHTILKNSNFTNELFFIYQVTKRSSMPFMYASKNSMAHNDMRDTQY